MAAKEKRDERDRIEGPVIEQQDWDALEGAEPTSTPDNGDLRYEPENQSGHLPEEDDDNEYQESDEALPDDEEERALRRDPAKERGRLDEA